MQTEISTIEETCPTAKLAVYLDGELTPDEELALESHLADCQNCREELNLQKKIFGALNLNQFEDDEIELPKDFAKIVATRAESGVSGIRSTKERKRAIVLSVMLFAVILILGVASETRFDNFGKLGEQAWAFAGFVGSLVYHLALGAAIILRSLSSEVVSGQKLVFAVAGCLTAIICFSLARAVFKQNRF